MNTSQYEKADQSFNTQNNEDPLHLYSTAASTKDLNLRAEFNREQDEKVKYRSLYLELQERSHHY